MCWGAESSLEDSGIGAEGAREVAEALHSNSSVQRLRWACLSTSSVVRCIAVTIASVPPAMRSLGGNELGAEGARHVAQMLRVNGTLQQLE